MNDASRKETEECSTVSPGKRHLVHYESLRLRARELEEHLHGMTLGDSFEPQNIQPG